MPWWQERVTGQIVHFCVNRKQRDGTLCSAAFALSSRSPAHGCGISHDQGASSHPSESSLKTPLQTCSEVRLSDLAYSICSQADGEKSTITSPWKFLLRFKLLNSEESWVGDKPFAWQSLGTVDTVQTPSVFFDVLFSTTVTSGWPGQSYQLDDYCLTLP